VRDVHRTDEGQLFQSEDTFSASFLFAGQIGTERPRLFQIYSAGNFIEATSDTPFLQIGEHKYGKPILDRVSDPGMRLGQAAKLVLLSFDSTIRSNLSVGMPIDLVVYARDTLKLDRARRIERDDPYFQKLSGDWGKALRRAFADIEEFDI
jgi:putative proteasome-type protease